MLDEADLDRRGGRRGRARRVGSDPDVARISGIIWTSRCMRIGIFSDIHANIEALSAVLEAFKSERIDKYFCLGDTVGYGASPNECCDLDPQDSRRSRSSATTTPPSPAGWTTRTTTTPPARRSTCTRASSRPRTWRGSRACRTRSARATSRSATARRSTSRSSSTSSRPSRRAVPRHLGRARRRHVHRPLAPVQGVRADPRRGVEVRRDQVRDPARAPLHRQRRLGRPAARLRQPRELHDLRHRREARSSSSASSTTSSARRRRSSRPSSSATSATACSSASDAAPRRSCIAERRSILGPATRA